MNSWQQVRVFTQQAYVDELEQFFSDAGMLSLTVSDGADEAVFVAETDTTPLWQHVILDVLFANDYPLSPLLAQLQQQWPEALQQPCETTTIVEQNWQQLSQAHFQRFSVENRVLICPSWDVQHHPKQQTVVIDPGLAFGTGTHPTTKLCLAWLAQQVEPNDCVIDFGCGSGILALAAAALGAGEVYAIDNDPQAISATQHNLSLNRFDHCQFYYGLNDEVNPIQADILIANILQNPLISLAPYFAKLIKPNAKLALTGILASQVQTIINAYAPFADLEITAQQGEWVLLTRVCRV